MSVSSAHSILRRLALIFFSLLWLVVACLGAANAHFAVVLRDQGDRPNNRNHTGGILDTEFRSIQNQILGVSVLVSITAAWWAIFGVGVTVGPKCLRCYDDVKYYYRPQAVLGAVLLVLAGYLACSVHGYEGTLQVFAHENNIPYYGTVYYGNVAQAIYGAILVLLNITIVLNSVFESIRRN